MMNEIPERTPPVRLSPWDLPPYYKYDLEHRARMIKLAKASPLLDAAWMIVHYNRQCGHWKGVPYPKRIEFSELERDWTKEEIEAATSRALALDEAAMSIGDRLHHLKFKNPACEIAQRQFQQAHPGFSAKVYEDVIMYGCVLAR